MMKKTKLIEILELALRLEQEFTAGLTDEEKQAVGTLERWSAKDNLSHNGSWVEHLVHNLAAYRQGQPTHEIDDLDGHNNADYKVHQTDSWQKVIERSNQAFQDAIAEVRLLTTEQIDQVDLLPSRNHRPTWRIIAGEGCLHPISHQASYYSQHGRPEEAGRLYATIIPVLSPLSDDPSWQGLLKYDQACGYALSGMKTEAITALKTALSLSPEITEWSKLDSDLESLRADAAYWEIYN